MILFHGGLSGVKATDLNILYTYVLTIKKTVYSKNYIHCVGQEAHFDGRVNRNFFYHKKVFEKYHFIVSFSNNKVITDATEHFFI